MQSKKKLALTPALSPGRGRSVRATLRDFPNRDSFEHGQMVLPLPGERAGVRADFMSTK
jgi:hypothetical protein